MRGFGLKIGAARKEQHNKRTRGLFSKEGFLELTARLPYVKVGPVRFVHMTYLLMAVAWMTVAHALVEFYDCSRGEYDYYCQDDELDCLVPWLADGY